MPPETGRPIQVMPGYILLATDDDLTRELLRRALASDGFHVLTAASRSEALAMRHSFDVVLTDIDLGLLAPIKARSPTIEVVVMTGSTCLDDALAAVRDGAFDFVLKPFFVDEVSLTVACAAARRNRQDLTMPLGFITRNHDLAR